MGVKFESLESRQLMSSATLTEGVLRVRGDDVVNDTIVLARDASRQNIVVTINGDAKGTFARADITRITVNGKSGRDHISLDEVNGRISGFKLEIYGGEGNDTIRGGSGKDVMKVFGEAGNDQILLCRGYLDGGAGNDTIDGSAGKDYIFGGDGNDYVDAEEGNDVIWGGAGNDTLEGDEGNDIVFGGDGNDSITGGIGNDRLYGNAGIDTIRGEDGDDTLYGGAHEDQLYGDAGVDVRDYDEYSKIESLMNSQLAKAKAYVA